MRIGIRQDLINTLAGSPGKISIYHALAIAWTHLLTQETAGSAPNDQSRQRSTQEMTPDPARTRGPRQKCCNRTESEIILGGIGGRQDQNSKVSGDCEVREPTVNGKHHPIQPRHPSHPIIHHPRAQALKAAANGKGGNLPRVQNV